MSAIALGVPAGSRTPHQLTATSPGTSRTDRIEKLREYQATESIQRYVILEQDSIAATVFIRQGTDWIAHALTSRDTLRLPARK